MRIIYKITRIAHLPDGQTIETVIEEVDSRKNEEIKDKANLAYNREVEELNSYYLPTSPFDYNPCKGIGYALNLELVWDTDTGEGGHQKKFPIRTTYRRSSELAQAMEEKEKELLNELADPKYPVDRFWLDGGSMIGFCEWQEFDFFYEVVLVKQIAPNDTVNETLYKIRHRRLGESRKIALSLLDKEAERFGISDAPDHFDAEKGPLNILVVQLIHSRMELPDLWVDMKPQLHNLEEDQRKEEKIFHRHGENYDKQNRIPSTVNQIEDLWTADHLTVHDYAVMDPYKKYDLVRYVYNLYLVKREGTGSISRPMEEFTHHDLNTARKEALKVYNKVKQDLKANYYSPDILNKADNTKESYSCYLQLSEVRGDLKIITEASFSYDGTDISKKDEERRIFELLKRESLSPGMVDNRQKTCFLKDNSKTLLKIKDDSFDEVDHSSDDDDDGLPF